MGSSISCPKWNLQKSSSGAALTNICSQIYVIFLTKDAQKRQKPRCALIAVLNGLNEIELHIQWQRNQIFDELKVKITF